MDRILTIGSAGIAALMALDRIAAAVRAAAVRAAAVRAERDETGETSHWRAAAVPVTSDATAVARD